MPGSVLWLNREGQNLRELHEAATSMDFFRRTVAALGGQKPEAGQSDALEWEPITCWISAGNQGIYYKSSLSSPYMIRKCESSGRIEVAPSASRTIFRPTPQNMLPAPSAPFALLHLLGKPQTQNPINPKPYR